MHGPAIGRLVHQLLRHGGGELPHVLPARPAPQRNHDVQPLAAGGLDEAHEPQLVEPRAHLAGGIDDLPPRRIGVGIDVEHHAVGLLDAILATSPNVDLQHSHLHQSRQARRIVHDHVRGRALRFLHFDPAQDVRLGSIRMLLDEAVTPRSRRTPQQHQRASHDVREHERRGQLEVARQIALRDPQLGVEHFSGVRELDAGAAVSTRPARARRRAARRHARAQLAASRHARRTRARSTTRSGGALRHHFAHRLVLAQSMERRMPQASVSGPAGERHFRDQRGLRPVDVAQPRRVREHRRIALELAQSAAQIPQ